MSEEAALSITKMQFCSDKFTDGDLADLGHLANLKSLEISSQNVRDLSNLPALSSLEALDLDVPCGDAAAPQNAPAAIVLFKFNCFFILKM